MEAKTRRSISQTIMKFTGRHVDEDILFAHSQESGYVAAEMLFSWADQLMEAEREAVRINQEIARSLQTVSLNLDAEHGERVPALPMHTLFGDRIARLEAVMAIRAQLIPQVKHLTNIYLAEEVKRAQ